MGNKFILEFLVINNNITIIFALWNLSRGVNTKTLPISFKEFSVSVATFVGDFGDGYVASTTTENINLSQIKCAAAGWGGSFFGGLVYCICMGY